ncbi:MAG: choice-of-anchor L domain-containing protein [Chitinophagaceae bacterium]|nr:choice-of-anchor L domain-containing protein [Chitinophagaceae bacterium]
MRGDKLILTIVCVLGWLGNLNAQVTVTNSNNAAFLASKLIGPGVDVSNATMLCNSNQSGFFISPSSLLNMDSGIVLTTGLASTNSPFNGVNGQEINFANQNQGTAGDPDLTALASISTYDRCILEFDFKGDGDTIYFEYKFGSEEYPAFNCTNYNDVFGFFISGPGITGSQNLALIPGTSIPVAINSVNNGVVVAGGNISNCTSMGAGSPFTSLYLDNTGGADLTYTGFTKTFKAKSFIQACSTYHIKLAIADGFDQIFDSGVFLKAGSFKSNTYHLSFSTDSMSSNPPYVIEGCDSIVLKIKRDNFQTAVTQDTVTLQVAGTATNGVDYTSVVPNYVFTTSLNDSVKTIYIDPFNDLITEGTETVTFYLKNKCNTVLDSITIQIKDPKKFTVFNNDTTICAGASVQVNGVFDVGLNLSWSPAAGVSNTTIINPVLTPTVTTNYILTASYGNCDVVKDTLKVTVQPLPTITASSTAITCTGLNNGTITAFGTVGSNPLSFTLMPGATILTGSPSTFTNLVPGTYTVTISSGLGCTKTAVKTITEPLPVIWGAVSAVDIGCNAGNVGQISASASGGTGAMSYTLTPGNITNTSGNFNALAAGVYVVTAKDANNCSITTNVTIVQATTLSWFLVTPTNIACSGNTTGSIFTSATGGTGTITYTLQPGSQSNTSGSFNTLSAGTYSITAMDATGCLATTVVTLTQPSTPISLGNPTVTNASCYGTSSGAVSISATGGTGTLTYLLNPPGSSNTAGVFTGKPAGNYTITVTDANGCTKTTTFTITQPGAMTVVTNNVFPTCVPGNNGSIQASVTGGAGSYTYKLNTGTYQSSNSFTGLVSGNYTVTIKDANNCTTTVVVPLQISNQITLTNSTPLLTCTTNVTTVNVSASGGTAPYTYTLMPNNISNNIGQFPGIDTGMYTVTAVDANGCSATLQINILIPPELQFVNFSVTNIPCTGIGSGNVAVAVGGGVLPYTYQINPPGTTNTSGIFNSLSAGFYTITASDANGCTASSVAHIVVSPPLSIGAPTIYPVTCFGTSTATVQINPIGGSFPMVYTLNPGGLTNITGHFTNLPAGTYTVSVLDAGNCTNTGSFIITQPAALTLTNIVTTPPTCVPASDGTITPTVTGGTTPYNYNSGSGYQASSTLGGLNVGLYTVTIKDANNCTVSTTINLINPTAPYFSSVSVNQALCAGSATGTIQVVIGSGTTPINYTISPLGLTNTNGVFNNLPVNTYTIQITDAANCVIDTTASVLQPSAIAWTNVSYTGITCNGLNNGTITAQAAGGQGTLTYKVMPGNMTNTTGAFTSLTNATYTLSVSDANNCSITSIINITQPSVFFWNGVTASNAACYNLPTAAINAPASGGTGTINYTLMPGSITNNTGAFPTIMSGAYTVTAVDANGCTLTTAFNLTQPASYPAITTTNTIPTCVPGNDATITVNTTGGTPNYLYSINSLPNQMSNVFTGIGISTYTVTVTDFNGCTVTSVIPVINNNAPNITSVNATNILCYGGNTGSIITNVTGGVGVLNYQLQPLGITNSNGIFPNLTANNYTISVTDANNCSATSNVILTQPPMLMWDSVDNRDVACYGGGNGVVTSSASGGSGLITYNLLPTNVVNYTGVFFGLGVGQYTLTATDTNGCVVTAVFQINQPPPITWTTVTVNPVSCIPNTDGSILVGATGGNGQFDYKLMPGNVQNTTGSFPNLPVGTYTVTAKDFLNCTLTTIVTIIQGVQVNATATTTPATCVPGCDGTSSITASGGNAIYTYSNNGSAFQAINGFSNLCSGSYTVIIKDGNNCTGTVAYTISTANGPSVLNAAPGMVSCFGGSNGSLSASVVGGVGPFNYSLQPGAITNTTGLFTGLNATAYTIQATDANGCSISTIALVPQPTQIQFSTATTAPVSCFGGSNGQITSTASGGTGAVQYSLLPGNITNTFGTFSGLTAGIYTIQATDANGCSTSTLVTVIQPNILVFAVAQTTPVSCYGGNNGSILLNTSGGTTSIGYTLQPGNITNNTGSFTNLIVGTYTAIATDANGCSVTTVLTMNQPTPLQITGVSSTIPTCVPGGDATLTITASGATPPYSYSVNAGPFQTGNVINNLSLGNYTITVKDANNCTATSVTQIISPNSPIITSVTTTPASCIPGCDGTATITSSNGTGLHQYALNGFAYQVSNLFQNLCLNTYTVSVKDANGCTGSSVFTIVNPAPPVITNIISTQASCLPGCDGSLTVQSSGGSGATSYSLNGISFQSSSVFLNLCAALYTITVKDTAGCSSAMPAAVTTTVGPVLTGTNHTNVLCYGQSTGSISLSVFGGTAPINYVLNPLGITSNVSSFNNLPANTYSVLATDAHGCTLSTSITLTQPPPLQFGAPSFQPPVCAGNANGSILAPVSGGSGSITFGILPSGTYVPPSSFIGLSGNTTYTITATDGNGCSISTTLFIPDPLPVVLNTVSADSVTCFGLANASVSAAGNGGTGTLTYTLLPVNQSNSSGNFINLSGGNYTVVLTDANGCSVSSTTSVFEPTPIVLLNATSSNITCYGLQNGSIQVSASGGMPSLSYTLNPGTVVNSNGLYSNLSANTYTVLVKDANNCSLSTLLSILEPPLVHFNNVITNNVQCSGLQNGVVTASASGGTGILTYNLVPGNISNTNGQFSGLGVNTYTITATDVNGCTTVTTIQVTQPPPLDLMLDSIHHITCFSGNDGFIGAHAVGGTPAYTFTLLPSNLSNSTGSFNLLTANTYMLKVTDAQGCKDSIFPITLVQPPQIIFTQVDHEDITCYYDSTGSITVAATGGTGTLTYSINPTSGTQVSTGNFQNMVAGTYTVTVKDIKNCTISTVVIIQQNLQIEAVVNYTEPICHGEANGSIEVIATGGVPPLTYSINGSAFTTLNNFNNLTAGTYTVIIQDTKNCIADTLLILTEPDKVGAMVKVQNEICTAGNDGRVTVVGTGGRGDYVYILKPGVNINKTGKFTGLSQGSYTLTVKDSSHCEYTEILTIEPGSEFMQIAFEKQDVGCYGFGNDAWAKALVTGGAPPYAYKWDDPSASTTALVEHLTWGNYQVWVTDSNGCITPATVQINPGTCCNEVFIPNVFSPNDDNLNDLWRVITSAGMELRQLSVYNRWGNKVFDTNDITQGWDGNYKKVPCDVGTYYYIFRYKCLFDGQEYFKKGDVTLLR